MQVRLRKKDVLILLISLALHVFLLLIPLQFEPVVVSSSSYAVSLNYENIGSQAPLKAQSQPKQQANQKTQSKAEAKKVQDISAKAKPGSLKPEKPLPKESNYPKEAPMEIVRKESEVSNVSAEVFHRQEKIKTESPARPAVLASQKTSVKQVKVESVKPENVEHIEQPQEDAGQKEIEQENVEKLAEKEPETGPSVKKTIAPENVAAEPVQPATYVLGSASNPKPRYPSMARRRGWEGDVVLGVNVAADGSIDSILIIKGAPYGALTHAAWETVKEEWTFEAAVQDGKRVPSYIEVPISFRLKN